jgi:hypothetical protein
LKILFRTRRDGTGAPRVTLGCIVTHLMTKSWLLTRDTAVGWVNHKDAQLGAALAYYSVFSFGPLIVIAVAIAGFIFGQDAARGEVEVQLRGAPRRCRRKRPRRDARGRQQTATRFVGDRPGNARSPVHGSRGRRPA